MGYACRDSVPCDRSMAGAARRDLGEGSDDLSGMHRDRIRDRQRWETVCPGCIGIGQETDRGGKRSVRDAPGSDKRQTEAGNVLSGMHRDWTRDR